MPAIVAEYLGLPQLTHVRKLVVDGDKVTAERETDEGVFHLEATLPAIVSVNEKINEPRFPSFKGIMAAKKKEVTVLTLAEIEDGLSDRFALLASGPRAASPRHQTLRALIEHQSRRRAAATGGESTIPIDGETGLSRLSSCQLITPGFRCGSRPVSSKTRMAIART